MVATSVAPQQFNQPSRKGKRAWRKNVDVSEVNEGLERLQDEVRQGGVIAEKSSDDLFTLDTTGDKTIQRAYHNVHKPLKSDEILALRSAVPSVGTHKRSDKVTDGIVEPSSKRQKRGKISHKDLERLRKVADSGNHAAQNVEAESVIDHDPWASTAPASRKMEDPRLSFLEKPKPLKAPETLKHKSISLAANGKRISAVRAPQAEASYNPDSNAYFNAFMREGEKELVAEEKRIEEAAKAEDLKARIAATAAEGDSQMTLAPEWDDESEWEGFQSEAETGEGVAKSKQAERKTKAERNKIKRRKEREQRAKWEAQMEKRNQQVGQAKIIAKALDKKSLTRSKKNSHEGQEGDDSESDGEEVRLRRHRFGKYFPPSAPLELVLPSELQESLRLLKPEGNILNDRYRNMILRGKFEARQFSERRKPQRTTSEKWSYKDWKLK